jgi:hypothetical protein
VEKLVAASGVVILLFGLMLVFAFLFAFVTQLAWAGSVAQIFHLPELNFWQAFCLNLLGGMVCKGSASGHNSK